jgi:hypothetical protein
LGEKLRAPDAITIEYLCMDLLWGKGIYELLRFVLVKSRGKHVILVCTDVNFTAE